MIVEARNCPAPAKLNLFLHVTGRRANRMHTLETVFELIDLADRLDFRLRDDGAIVRRDPVPGITIEQDLCVRAARALAIASETRLGVEIAVRKRIPIGGGLGGGSSDAATTLLVLNRLWGLGWPATRLARIGLELGADVPVFIRGQPAYATGVGEQLRAIALPRRLYVVVAPPVNVPTAEIFQAPELTRDTNPIRISGLSQGLSAFRGRNDLESVACRRYPEIALALTALRRIGSQFDPRGAGFARMSGSGGCVFLPLTVDNASAAAESIRVRLASQGVGEVSIAGSLARHPLREWAFGSGAAGFAPAIPR